MVKRRVCETCLYFEPAGFANSGWCHHPSRRQNSDVRLVVRANELGCRNGWNADLWVPADTGGATRREHPHDPIGNRARAEVEPAEQNDLITSIVAARTDNIPLAADGPAAPASAPRSIEEDIFVKQTPSRSWNTGPISPQPATELVQDPRAAILRARDQFKERRKSEGRLADRQLTTSAAPLLASAREAQKVDDFDLSEPEPAPGSIDARYENRPLLSRNPPASSHDHRPVSPVTLREIERPFPSMTEFPDDRRRFESIPVFEPDYEEMAEAEVPPVDTWIETRQLDTVPPEPYEVDELFDDDELGIYAESEPYEEEAELSVRHRESMLDRFFRQRRVRRQPAAVADEPVYDEETRNQPEPAHALVRPIEDEPVAPVAAASPRPAPRSEPVIHDTHRMQETRNAFDHRAGDRGYRTEHRSSLRSESRQHAEAPVSFDDDFALPPPLPAYEPTNRPERAADHRARARYEEPTPRARSAGRNGPIETPIADEFGDQPLFASQPTAQTDDRVIERPPSNQPAPVAATYRQERICRTCRDFRPSENGDRGWCNNKWAFSHRRMVDADDLACRNSLGSWWTPKDDVWRRDGDISRHAQQTPRVDEWLFGSSSDSNDRRRSGS